MVLVFPEAVNKQWCDGRIKGSGPRRAHDDVGFISRIIDSMIERYGIDSTRVYATGISNGGFMSICLAMDLSDRIAAIAPVAAQIPVALASKAPQLPISVMMVNGTLDPIVPFDGGHVRLFRFGRSRGEVLSTSSTVERFRRLDNCNDAPETSVLPDVDPSDGTRVEVERYAGCANRTEVILFKVVGGGHTWPGGSHSLNSRIVGPLCRDMSASEMILDFFLRHAR
jgi:polyhydroxybutyrate depolymerase